MIDYQFENLTKAFFKRQFAWFMIMSVIPFLVIIFVDLKGSVLTTALLISLIGQLGMYSFEIMAMMVQGLTVYFSDPWNYVDQLNLALYIAFCAMMFDQNSS